MTERRMRAPRRVDARSGPVPGASHAVASDAVPPARVEPVPPATTDVQRLAPEVPDLAASPARPRHQPDDVPVLPERSADDSDAGWNDASDSNDERLRRDVPPHW